MSYGDCAVMDKLIVQNLKTSGGTQKNNIVQTWYTYTQGTQYTSSSTTWIDIGLSLNNIVPSSASNKIYLLFSTFISHGTNNASYGSFRFLRNGSAVYTEAYMYGVNINYYHNERLTGMAQWLDSPATTSATTYTVQLHRDSASGGYDETICSSYGGNMATFMAMEIQG